MQMHVRTDITQETKIAIVSNAIDLVFDASGLRAINVYHVN